MTVLNLVRYWVGNLPLVSEKKMASWSVVKLVPTMDEKMDWSLVGNSVGNYASMMGLKMV